jgi:hypothetical protein
MWKSFVSVSLSVAQYQRLYRCAEFHHNVLVILFTRLRSTHFPVLFCTSEVKTNIKRSVKLPTCGPAETYSADTRQHATGSAILLRNTVRFLTTKIVSYTSWSSCNQKDVWVESWRLRGVEIRSRETWRRTGLVLEIPSFGCDRWMPTSNMSATCGGLYPAGFLYRYNFK